MSHHDPASRLAALQKRRRTKPAEQYIMNLPGVGKGMLDSLEASFDRPLVFDTASTENLGILGEFKMRNDTARVTINPLGMEEMRRQGRLETEGPITLVHEVIGHGKGMLRGTRGDEAVADLLGEAWLRQTGRDPLFRHPIKMNKEVGMAGHLTDQAMSVLLGKLEKVKK